MRSLALTSIALVAATSGAFAQADNDAPAQSIEPAAFERVSFESFRAFNNNAAPLTNIPEQFGGSGGGNDDCIWDNGPLDDITGHLAQTDDSQSFCVADDCLIKQGYTHFVAEIRVCFAVGSYYDGTMNKPQFKLDLYDDCDGRPGTLTATYDDPDFISAQNFGPINSFPGYNLWEVVFSFDPCLITDGPAHVWTSPKGIGEFRADGLYYWLSANNGNIQGAQGQIRANSGAWMDAADCGCPDVCTDFYLQACGHRCCCIKDNSPHDPTGGLGSLQLKGALIPTNRGADNFQIEGDQPVNLCAVKAWFATNCDVDKIFLEIYDNDCDSPVGITPIHVIDDGDVEDPDLPDFPIATDTGVDFAGCNIYELLWPKIEGVVLSPGQNYWISVVARSNGGILDKGVFMYRLGVTCDRICISEAQIREPFVEGLEEFTPISEAGAPFMRDLAFKIWTSPAIVPGACCLPGNNCISDVLPDICSALDGQHFPGEDCSSGVCIVAPVQSTPPAPETGAGGNTPIKTIGRPTAAR